MSNIVFEKKYPNVIIFTHNDADGLFSAMIIKQKYDNNLANNNWERNVQTYICSYNQTFNLEYFKEKVEQNYKPNMQNIIYMTDYAIQPNENMLKFWNWLTDKGCKFYWIDHHITAIENLKHLNIPGFQTSAKSGCMNTWYEVMKNEQGIPSPPIAINMINDFDTGNENSEYSKEKQLLPLNYYIESLGIDINDNTSELVRSLNNMLLDNKYTEQFIKIGIYVYKYIKRKFKMNSKSIKCLVWNELKCLVLNSSFNGSMQFEQFENSNNELNINTFRDADLLVCWSFDGNNYHYGIYSTKSNVNCGLIAQQYLSGGGHQKAAGGISKEFIFK